MKRWKLAFISCVIVLFVTNGLWAYAWLDQGVTIMYRDAVNSEQAQAIQDLGGLIVNGASSYSKKDLLHLLRQAKPEAFIVDNGDTVSYEGIRFRFSDDRLVEIEK